MSNKGHLESLTWLRGLAAFFVVISHSLRAAEVQYDAEMPSSGIRCIEFFDLGSFGVCLFFALSGYTLYLSNRSEMLRWQGVWRFYLRRFMRIWPTFAVSLLIYVAFIEIFKVWYIGENKILIGHFSKGYTLGNFFQYLSLTFNFIGPADLFIGPYWSLPVEFQYYLILPLVVLGMKHFQARLFFPIIVGGAMYGMYLYLPEYAGGRPLFQFGYVFLGGVCISHGCLNNARKIPVSIALPVLFLIFLSVSAMELGTLEIAQNIPFLSNKWNFHGLAALVCMLLVAKANTPRLSGFLKDLLTDYGEVSYSIYLFHMVFVGFSVIALAYLGIRDNGQILWFTTVFSVIFSYLFARQTNRYIERPLTEVGKNLFKK